MGLGMPPLIKTNPYLATSKARRDMLLRSAMDSSAFEGARGLKGGAAHGAGLCAKARSSASVKRRGKGA